MNIHVYVTPKAGILDPHGATVERALPALGFSVVSGVRIGKFIELQVQPAAGADEAAVHEQVDDMCRKLLANPIIEEYRFEVDD